MLIKNINDDSQHLKKVADFLAKLKPSRSYLSLPIRPPAEKWVQVSLRRSGEPEL